MLNNPLSFTDPSGFSSWTKFRDTILKPVVAIAAAWFLGPIVAEWASFALLDAGLAVGSEIAAGNAIGAVASGFASGGIAGGNIQSALQGAFFGGLLNVGATAFGLHGAAGFGGAKHLGQIALHAAVGCAQGAAAGGSCRSGALAGGVSAFASPALKGLSNSGKYVAAAIIGGIASKLGGGKFENGALTGAFGYLLNDLNLFSKADRIQPFAERLIKSNYNPDELNSYGHGNVGFVVDPDNPSMGLSVEDHAKLLRQDSKWSPSVTVRLWQCLCGSDSEFVGNYAQKLANALQTTVIASENYVRWPVDGSLPGPRWDWLADQVGISIDKPSAWKTYQPQRYYSNEGRPR